ncbi:hypothetical protein CNBK0880 [Cryptococcus deneoformans B-3501A]|uniref:Major facilitator superfamily (MFS) profile domain-containing protein n=1 Tax=Cryptococcus deneoformans (strain JEC21 / ATCC MYA-565) TaxID=214684 RepID=Q5K9A2_CRYD1|nr:hypothetical protein CNK02660 [Cryptococcus neoformans var. neoformans JEC21]XP_772714.1 hypothetical protein CNBK0880 [Cryptococcus neoformans var. neoformans B-3501A]AAW46348.1 hypothetical protein CNK02660 [Cryptococcus neoformans var. neoformans JEC21]EAL18067.1 hypothetical protein CNBK0880 [Cryptococcus neoformans var. neoformans B-3501A]
MAAVDDKVSIEHVESGDHYTKHHVTQEEVKHGDNALKYIGDERVEVTQEDDARIRRKTDKYILSLLAWVYFLQILDKTVLGYANTFGLSEDTNLVNNQYSLLGSINAIVQLAWQPFSSYLIVKVPARYLMPAMVFGWGAAQACMAAAHNFGGLMASRAILGLFEAGCLPLFSLLTSQWYRRSEQPVRVAVWYSTNGLATIVAALLSFGLSHVDSPHIKSWQLIFIVCGIITCVTAPIVYMFVDADVASARFLTEEDKAKGIERLRANQTGTGSNEFKVSHVWELFCDPKSYLFLAISLLLNVGASVTNIFGPTLIKGFGFNSRITSLLNMPFGFLQFVAILAGCYCAYKFKLKSAVLAVFIIPVIIGLALLYVENAAAVLKQAPALVGYYLLAFLFGANPIIVSWIVANTGGQTKKALLMSVYNAGSSAGNIIGPLLFQDKDKPHYLPGIKATLGIFCALMACVGITAALLFALNKQRQRQRVAVGKPQYIKDTSMSNKYEAYGADDVDGRLGQNALLDLTDFKNDEFVYVY